MDWTDEINWENVKFFLAFLSFIYFGLFLTRLGVIP